MLKYFVVLFALMSAGTRAGNLLLLEFPTANFDSTRAALQELESSALCDCHHLPLKLSLRT